jgi:CRP-like cAMP-binding protein
MEVLAMHRLGVLDGRRKSVLLDDAAENGMLRLEYDTNRKIFRQGEPARFVFYLRQGMVRLSATSQEGKEAIVATLGPGEFLGEECLAGQPLRITTATAITQCTFTRIEKKMMTRMLRKQHDISALFVTHLLSRSIRYEADLVDQLFNSSEKRLARALLLLSQFGKKSRAKTIIPPHQSGRRGADGRHNPVAGQSFHAQVQEARLYRLRRRRVDGQKWPPQGSPSSVISTIYPLISQDVQY